MFKGRGKKPFDPLAHLDITPETVAKEKARQQAARQAAEKAKANPDPKVLKPKPKLSQKQKDNLVKALQDSAKARKPRKAPPSFANRAARFMGRTPALTALSIVFGATPVGTGSEIKKYKYSDD